MRCVACNVDSFTIYFLSINCVGCMGAQSVWLCVLMALVGFVLELNKERFRRLEYGYSVALLTFPLVAIPGVACTDPTLRVLPSCH